MGRVTKATKKSCVLGAALLEAAGRRYGQDMAIPVFIAYARADEPFRKELVKHLALLEKQEGLISIWHDGLIEPSAKWEAEIEKHLLEARLIVFLVSADFFHSEYCHEKEMKLALERHERGEARVVPVIVRACLWQSSRIAHIQFLPADAKPVDEWAKRDAAWVDVVNGIRAAVLKLREEDQKGQGERLAREQAEEEVQKRDQEWLARSQAYRLEQAKRAEAEEEEARKQGAMHSQRAARKKQLILGFVGVIMAFAMMLSANAILDILHKKWVKPSSFYLKIGMRPYVQRKPPDPTPAHALADIAPMAFKKLDAASFTMGSPKGESWRDLDERQRDANVVAVEIGVREVTQKQWKTVMGDHNFDCKWGCEDDMPAHSVTWFDTLAFMNKLTELDNKKLPENSQRTICYSQKNGAWTWDRTCTGYRLPTETEWEYAARAGTKTAYSFGDDPKDLCTNANGADMVAQRKHRGQIFSAETICEDDKYPELAPVGSFKPNPWDLYDMHGNVSEWVWDLYAVDPASFKPSYAGPETSSDNKRILRGGSFLYAPKWLRSSSRYAVGPMYQVVDGGFRCVRNAPLP